MGPLADAVAPVRQLWESMEARAWATAADMLADGFVCSWPQTGERFRGRDNYMEMNRAHPAPNWRIAIQRLDTPQWRAAFTERA
jgi:hypothetical protein